MRFSLLALAPVLLLACDPDEQPECAPIAVAPHNCSQAGCIGDAWSSDKAEYGGACKVSADCGSGLCATDPSSGQQYCTQTCVATAEAPCPRGAGCFLAEGELHVCGPPVTALSGAADSLCP